MASHGSDETVWRLQGYDHDSDHLWEYAQTPVDATQVYVQYVDLLWYDHKLSRKQNNYYYILQGI